MRRINPAACAAATAAMLAIVFSTPAHAYIGPGAGLSIAGSILAVLATIVFGIIGFVWYPIRRLLRKRKTARSQREEPQTQAETAAKAQGRVSEADQQA